MKKTLMALALAGAALLGCGQAHAQKAELHLGYGGYTQMDATDMPGHMDTAWGAVTLGFNFKVAPKFWLGPSYTFSSASFKHGGGTTYYNVIMLNGRYEYWRNSIVKLYGHVGLGADISCIDPEGPDNSWNKSYFAFQVSPLGAQVDISKGASLFGELGFGAQGLVQVGFRFGL